MTCHLMLCEHEKKNGVDRVTNDRDVWDGRITIGRGKTFESFADRGASGIEPMEQFTKLQGQYLAFIAAYSKLNRRPPAEADFQRYFGVSAPSVHNMIVTLERRGLIKRRAGQPRSIELAVPASQVPPLD